MSDQSEIIFVPRGKANESAIPVDLGFWGRQEQRLAEVAFVTPTKAPELLSHCNRCALDLENLIVTFEMEQQYAIREAERRKAEVLLDVIPKLLIEKGLATSRNPLGSEDVRAAVLAQDTLYAEALERVDQIKAVAKLLRGKFDAFERAFIAVRTLVREQNFNFTNPSKELSHGRDVEQTAPVGTKRSTAFGTPRYSNQAQVSRRIDDDIPY